MDAPSEKETEEYTVQKTKITNRPSNNYNFLKKFVVYAKTIQPIMITISNRDIVLRIMALF